MLNNADIILLFFINYHNSRSKFNEISLIITIFANSFKLYLGIKRIYATSNNHDNLDCLDDGTLCMG